MSGVFGTNVEGSGGSNINVADWVSGFKMSEKSFEAIGRVDWIVRVPLNVAVGLNLWIVFKIYTLVY